MSFKEKLPNSRKFTEDQNSTSRSPNVEITKRGHFPSLGLKENSSSPSALGLVLGITFPLQAFFPLRYKQDTGPSIRRIKFRLLLVILGKSLNVLCSQMQSWVTVVSDSQSGCKFFLPYSLNKYLIGD